MEIEEIINNEKWRFAKTYAKTHPHEYIVREKCSNADYFDCLCEYIKNNGHYEYFFSRKGIYLSIGNYTYWQMGNIINRRWNDMYKVNKDGQIYKVENWEELLKDGRVLY